MTTTTRPVSPARAVLRTEFRLFRREPGSIFWIMVFPVALLVILGSIPDFRDPDPNLGGQRTIDLYVPILILLSAIMASVQAMPTVISAYREQKVLRRFATTPARPWQLLAAQFVLHGGAVLVGGLIVMLVGRLVFDVRLPGSTLAYVLVLVLALLAALAIGGLIAGLSRTAKVSAAVGGAVFFLLMFTSGLWIPVQVMPGLLGDVVELTPFGAAARGLDQAALGQWPDLRYLVTLVAWTAGLGALGARWFRWQ